MIPHRHFPYVASHLCIWVAMALSVLLLVVSCPVRGAEESRPVVPPPAVNGAFRIAVLKRDVWVPAGETAHGTAPNVAQLVLRGLTLGDPIRVRITTQAPGAAQLDMVLLNGRPPYAARNALLRKLVAPDFDVTNAQGRAIEVTFVPGGETSATLTVLGRIEPKTVSATPFLFPSHNQGLPMGDEWMFYTYRVGDRPGSLTVNGELDEENLPGAPLFAEHVPSSSGHPDGVIYGWVVNDGKTLYAALDFTPDNTYDADRDYAKVFAQVKGTWREFKLDVSNRAWGRSGYTYTSRVPYEHKTYEFAIPLSELGLADAVKGTPLKLAFALYGTASPVVKAP